MLRNVLFISLEIVGVYEDILIGGGINHVARTHSTKKRSRAPFF